MVRNGLQWLRGKQNADGGWGETNDSYARPELAGKHEDGSMAEQTAWAMLGQMAVGEGDADSVHRGAAYLLDAQNEDGFWMHPYHNTGLPRIFHLKYHGYTAYFPLWALGRYRRLAAARVSAAKDGRIHRIRRVHDGALTGKRARRRGLESATVAPSPAPASQACQNARRMRYPPQRRAPHRTRSGCA
jgi:hypothetical protein